MVVTAMATMIDPPQVVSVDDLGPAHPVVGMFGARLEPAAIVASTMDDLLPQAAAVLMIVAVADICLTTDSDPPSMVKMSKAPLPVNERSGCNTMTALPRTASRYTAAPCLWAV